MSDERFACVVPTDGRDSARNKQILAVFLLRGPARRSIATWHRPWPHRCSMLKTTPAHLCQSESALTFGDCNHRHPPPQVAGDSDNAHVFAAPHGRSLADVRQLANKYLTRGDLSSFQRATGVEASSLFSLADEWANKQPDPKAADALFARAIMSSCKFFAHPLNIHGLHPLRALLLARLSDVRRTRQRAHPQHPLLSHFLRDGLVVIPNFDYPMSPATDRTVPDAMLRVFRMVSGYRRVPTEWSAYSNVTHTAGDPQYYMHVDTVQPTWKVFIFIPGTHLEHGPFHYVNGSHGAASTGKLRWLLDRTRRLTHVDPRLPNGTVMGMAAAANWSIPPRQRKSRALKGSHEDTKKKRSKEVNEETKRKRSKEPKSPKAAARDVKTPKVTSKREAATREIKTSKATSKESTKPPRPVKVSALAREGPYRDETHGPGGVMEGSIRFLGFDPVVGTGSVRAELASYQLLPPTPIVVPASARSPTLVIADTSGLHYRGHAQPGTTRTAARLEGWGGGCGGCIPRKNAFACEWMRGAC